MRRHVVITSSIAFHALVVAGVYVASLWHIDRLEARTPRRDVTAIGEPQLEAGELAGAPAQPLQHKHPDQKKTVTELVVPTARPEPPADDVRSTESDDTDGDGSGDGSGSGSGAGPGGGGGGGQSGGVTCGVPPEPCRGAIPPPVRPPPPPVTIVPPKAFEALRISGETQIQPPDPVKIAMRRDGRDRLSAVFKLCLSATGDVTSRTLLRSTGFAEYDTRLADAMRGWRYRPLIVDGRGVPSCGTVAFDFILR